MKTRTFASAKKSASPIMAGTEPTGMFAPRPFPKPETPTQPAVQARAESPENLGQLIDIPLFPPEQPAADAVQPVQAKPATPHLQREEMKEEDKDLALKPLVQRETMSEEEEELTQAKFQVQRQALPEEDEEDLAQRSPALQREAMPEEDEKETLQAKSQLQREALPEEEAEAVQMQPQLQRETLPEEDDELQAKAIQPKLTIGQPGDKYEQEADSMAAQVMRMPDPTETGAMGPWGDGGKAHSQYQRRLDRSSPVQREVIPEDEEELQTKPQLQREAMLEEEDELQMKPQLQRETIPDEEDETLQAKPDNSKYPSGSRSGVYKTQNSKLPSLQAKDGAPEAPANFDSQLAQHQGSGQPLPDETRAFMEPRFGADFSNVRVHETPDLANAIHAQAFTHGQDIYFNSGKYNPRSSGGKELLAHELTHVVQQNTAKLSPRIQRWALPDERVMARVHRMDLIDAFQAYAEETASPTPDWPSRRAAIQQAIRERLNILARSGRADTIDGLSRQLASMPNLTSTDNWLERVLNHYRSKVITNNPYAENTDSEVPSNPELLAAAGATVSANNLSVSIYTAVPGVEREFRRAAQSFARDHRSLGVMGGRLVSGMRAAMPATSTMDVVSAVNNTIGHVRYLLKRPDAKVNTVAIFAHGVNASRRPGGRSYLNLTGGHQITNPQQTGYPNGSDQLPASDFANQISAALGNDARVIMYACEAGDSFYGGENADLSTPNPRDSVYDNFTQSQTAEAHQGALDDELARGDTSLADELRDALNATGSSREVWGHRTTGHTTNNPTWRRYGSGTHTGADTLFGEENAQSNLTPQEGWDLKQENIRRAKTVVRELVDRLETSPNIPAQTLQALQRRGHGLANWIARELPFAPTPFVEGDPPTVRAEVVQFFEHQAIHHESSN